MAHRGNWFEEEVLERTTGTRTYYNPKDRSKQLMTKQRVIEHSDQLPPKDYKSVMSTCITNQLEHPNYKALQGAVGPRQALLEAKLKQQVNDEFAKKQAEEYTENRKVKYVSDAMEAFNRPNFDPALKVNDPFVRVPTFHADYCTDTPITFYSDSVKNGATGNFPCTFVTTGNPFKKSSAFSGDIVKEQTLKKAETNERPRALPTVREMGSLMQLKKRMLDHVKHVVPGTTDVPGRAVRILIDTLWGMANENSPGIHIETFVNCFYTSLQFVITSAERKALLLAFDINSNNLISLVAFTDWMRGSLTPRAIELVDIVLASLASSDAVYNEGFVSEISITRNYMGDAKTLLSNLRVTEGQVSADDFFEYYADVFAELASASHFEAFIKAAWGL